MKSRTNVKGDLSREITRVCLATRDTSLISTQAGDRSSLSLLGAIPLPQHHFNTLTHHVFPNTVSRLSMRGDLVSPSTGHHLSRRWGYISSRDMHPRPPRRIDAGKACGKDSNTAALVCVQPARQVTGDMTPQGRIVVGDATSRQEEEANIVSTHWQGRHHIAAR